MHVLTGDAAPLRNLELCINRSHLSVERMVATPYASGLAALVDDELEMGAACIDMGGGTTTISVFADGKFVHADAIRDRRQPCHHGHGARPVDPPRRCRAAEGDARLGACRAVPTTATLVSIQPIGDDDGDVPLQVPRSVMTRIIRARIEETLELDARPAEPVRLRQRRRQARRADRRREPACRAAGGGAAHPRAQRPHRPSARRGRPAGGGQGPGLLDARSAC